MSDVQRPVGERRPVVQNESWPIGLFALPRPQLTDGKSLKIGSHLLSKAFDETNLSDLLFVFQTVFHRTGKGRFRHVQRLLVRDRSRREKMNKSLRKNPLILEKSHLESRAKNRNAKDL